MTENSVRYMQPPELRQVFTKKKLLSGTLTGQEKLNDTTVRQDCGDNMADSDSGGDLQPDVASIPPSCLHCLLSSSPARRLARDIFKVRKICFCEKFYTEMPADAHYKTASSLSEGKRRVKTYAESFEYKY